VIARFKSRTLAPSIWQPTALKLLFLSCVTDVSSVDMYISSLYVERFVLTEIKIIIIIIIIKRGVVEYVSSGDGDGGGHVDSSESGVFHHHLWLAALRWYTYCGGRHVLRPVYGRSVV